jgi:hypothetical protein
VGFIFTLRGKEVSFPFFTSSAMHSLNSSAPYSFQILPALRARRLYASTFFFGTAR